MFVRTADELRDALKAAEPGIAIELAPGEYEGPFVITRSVSLLGQERLTVLFRKDAPVVYVTAPDVSLDSILIERTVTDGTATIHDPNCEPTGQESMTAGEMLISLGELAPGYTLTLPLEIDTTGRTELAVTGLYGAQIAPSVLESAGVHTVTLTLDGKAIVRGEMLLGEITVRENGSTRFLWISGTVLESPLPDQRYALATKKTRLYPSDNGLPLDGYVLSALEGSSQSGRFAFVQRDQSGNLFLYVPGEPPAPLLLNDRALPRGTRVLLREHDTLRVSKTVLTVQTAEPPPIRLEPASVVFKDFDASFPEPVALTMKPNKSSWVGQLVPTVPWLTVSPGGNLRLSGSKAHSWQIGLTETVLDMPNGVYDALGGLLLMSTDHTLSIDVRLNINRPPIALVPQPLEIGAIEIGWKTDQTVDLQIANYGRGPWMGTVKSNVDWLHVITPMPISGEAWSFTPVQLKVTQPDDEHEPGKLEVEDALILYSADSSTQLIPVSVELLPPQGHLEVVSAEVMFDKVERGASPPPAASLQLRNSGGGVFRGTARSTAGWVHLPVTEFVILPGETRQLDVELSDVPEEAELNTPFLTDEIELNTGESIPVMVTLIELPPALAAHTVSFPPFVRGDPPPDATLTIRNMGPGIWRGTLVPGVAWLNVPDGTLLCAPGESLDVAISLSPTAADQLPAGLTRTDSAITVLGGRNPVKVAVHIDVRDVSTELVLETPTLNFGQVNGGAVDLPADTLRLLNASPSDWKGSLEVKVPWLAMENDVRNVEFDVPRMSVAEFKVLLSPAARMLPPGIISDDEAILVTGGDGKTTQRLPIRALLLMVEWAPVLQVKPARVTLNGSTPHTVTLRNAGKKAWTMQVNAAAWLEVTPAEVRLEPGIEVALTIRRRSEAALEGMYDDPRAVVIIGQGREVEIRVSG